MVAGVFTPYSTVNGFSKVLPSWVPALEQERIASYQVYEEIYWNHPETFKLVVRGTENKPIYIPSGRVIVETMNRFFCKGLGFTIDPTMGSETEQANAKLAFSNLFRRERLRSVFNANKRYGLIRGDMVFHVKADDTKLPGSRLSIAAIDPASYFPVYDDNNLDRIVKVHLVDQFVDAQNRQMIKRQTYERMENGQISSVVVQLLAEEFAKPESEQKIDQALSNPILLDPKITSIPVYHIRNFDEPRNPYGSSEMRGLEVMMAAINQSVSDEDIALALEGLGLYTTDSGAPLDDDGNPTDWIIGPGRVVERAANFKRVPGVGSVQPYKDHVGMIFDFMKQASGTPDIAIGRVDVQVAESGVALDLSMGPIMAKADEKEELVLDVLGQMFFDLRTMWFPTYEALTMDTVDVMPMFGDRLPVNRKQEVDLYAALVMTTPPIMSAATARERLAEKGIQFSSDEFARIMQEKAAEAEALAPADPQGDRLAADALPAAAETASGA